MLWCGLSKHFVRCPQEGTDNYRTTFRVNSMNQCGDIKYFNLKEHHLVVIAYNFAQGFRVSWENSNLSFMSLDQCRVPIYILPVLTIPYLLWVLRVFRYRSRRKEVYLKDPDVALIKAKTLSVQRCTLYALKGRHLVYVAEEAEPGRGGCHNRNFR